MNASAASRAVNPHDAARAVLASFLATPGLGSSPPAMHVEMSSPLKVEPVSVATAQHGVPHIADQHGAGASNAAADAAGTSAGPGEQVVGSDLERVPAEHTPPQSQGLHDRSGRFDLLDISHPGQVPPEPLDEETPGGHAPGPSCMLFCPSYSPEGMVVKPVGKTAAPRTIEGPVMEHEPADQPVGLPPGFKLVYKYRRTDGSSYLNYRCHCTCGKTITIDRWQKVDSSVQRHREHNPDLEGVSVASFNFRPTASMPIPQAPRIPAPGDAGQTSMRAQRPAKRRRPRASGGSVSIGKYLDSCAPMTEHSVPVYVRDPNTGAEKHGVMRLPSQMVKCGCHECKDSNAEITPNAFEAHGGRMLAKKWKTSIRVVTPEQQDAAPPCTIAGGPNSGNSTDATESDSDEDRFFVEKAMPLHSARDTPCLVGTSAGTGANSCDPQQLPSQLGSDHVSPPTQQQGMGSIDYFCSLDRVTDPASGGVWSDGDSGSTQPLVHSDSDGEQDIQS